MPGSRRAVSGDTGTKKTLFIWSFFTIGLGVIIGTGWVLLVGDWVVIDGGSIVTMIAFLIGTIFLFPIGAAFGELVVVVPISGGIIEYAGRTHGNNMSYITGWFLALGNGILRPQEVIVISTLVSDMFGGLLLISRAVKLYTIMGAGVCLFPMVIALGFVFYIASLNFRGISAAAELQTLLAKVLLVSILLAMGISFIKGGPSNTLPAFSRVIGPSPTTSANSMFAGIISVLVMTPFFYAGFDTIPQQTKEAVKGFDQNKFGKIISMALLTAGGSYMICIYSFDTIIPWTEFIQSTVPALARLKNINMVLYVTMLTIVTLGPMRSMNSLYGTTSHIMLAMGRKRQLPPSSMEIDGGSGAPKVANMVLVALIVVRPSLGKDVLVLLTNVSALAFIFSCAMVSFACLKVRKMESDLPRPYKVPGSKFGVSMVCLTGSIIITLMVVPFSPAVLEPVERAIATGWLVTGLILEAVSSKRSA